MLGITHNEKNKTRMENKVENLIVEWLKSGDENATNLAHKICVLFSVSNTEGNLCDKCYDTGGFYLGTTCPKCNRPFRSVKA